MGAAPFQNAGVILSASYHRRAGLSNKCSKIAHFPVSGPLPRAEVPPLWGGTSLIETSSAGTRSQGRHLRGAGGGAGLPDLFIEAGLGHLLIGQQPQGQGQGDQPGQGHVGQAAGHRLVQQQGLHPRRRMEQAREYGQLYAGRFPQNEKPNLLLLGPAGLGRMLDRFGCRTLFLLAEGVLGDVLLFRNEFHSSLAPVPGSWFFRRKIAGGGCLIDTGSHSIDLFRHLFGEITGAKAVLTHRFPATDVEDGAVLLVRNREGVSGVLVSSFGGVGRAEIEITGTLGRLRYEYGGEIRLDCPAANRREVIVPERGNGFAAEVAAFLRAIEAGLPPPVDIADGVRVQEVLDACYRNAP